MTELDRQVIKDRAKALLRQHAGPDNCITMMELHARITGEPIVPRRGYDQTRITRSVVDELRRDGCPIGNKGGRDGGYFWARSEAELDKTVRWFRKRAMSSLRQEAALRRIPFGELLKQYQIEFEQTN